MRHEFSNDATYEERAEQLRNEKRLRPGERPPTTLHSLASLDTSLDGRFAAESDLVSGAEPSVNYPRLPASSPWSAEQPQPGPEPPLGVEIDEQEPVGTPAEVAQSIAEFAGGETATGCARGPCAEPVSISASEALLAAPPPSAPQRSALPSDVDPGGGAVIPTALKIRKPRR
jgi:hypothetical protein